jgi:DNA gyrase subunit A
MGRNASGVRAIKLAGPKDEVVGMIAISDPTVQTVLVVSEKGYGKRTYLNDPEDNEPVYRITNRGGKGVKTLNITDKTGSVVAIKSVTDDDDLMIITKNGITIRMHVDELRVMGRATQGVRLINLRNNDDIAAIAQVERSEDEENESEGDESITSSDDNVTPDSDE